MAKYNPDMPSASYDKGDYNAILNSSIASGLVTGDMNFDSAEDASIYMARELDYIKAEVFEVEHPEFSARRIFPISHEIPDGAETVTYYTMDKIGQAKMISNYSTDLPRADVYGKPHTSPIKSIGISYGYSKQDMRAAKLARKPLDVRKGDAAKYANDRMFNKIAWAGDEATGLVGVLSKNNDVPIFALSEVDDGKGGKTTAFEYKTPKQILADINGMFKFIAKATKNVEKPDSLALPSSTYIGLSTTPLNDNSDMTILEFIKKSAPYVKSIVDVAELESDAGETNPYGKNVMFLYTNNKRKFTIEEPLAFFQYTAQAKGLEVEIPCESRSAGAVIYYPMSMCIAVGV